MTTEQNERLKDIFRAVLELTADAEIEALTQEASTAWDSLAHVSLMTGMESEFGTADSLEITSYEDAVALLERKGV